MRYLTSLNTWVKILVIASAVYTYQTVTFTNNTLKQHEKNVKNIEEYLSKEIEGSVELVNALKKIVKKYYKEPASLTLDELAGYIHAIQNDHNDDPHNITLLNFGIIDKNYKLTSFSPLCLKLNSCPEIDTKTYFAMLNQTSKWYQTARGTLTFSEAIMIPTPFYDKYGKFIGGLLTEIKLQSDKLDHNSLYGITLNLPAASQKIDPNIKSWQLLYLMFSGKQSLVATKLDTLGINAYQLINLDILKDKYFMDLRFAHIIVFMLVLALLTYSRTIYNISSTLGSLKKKLNQGMKDFYSHTIFHNSSKPDLSYHGIANSLQNFGTEIDSLISIHSKYLYAQKKLLQNRQEVGKIIFKELFQNAEETKKLIEELLSVIPVEKSKSYELMYKELSYVNELSKNHVKTIESFYECSYVTLNIAEEPKQEVNLASMIPSYLRTFNLRAPKYNIEPISIITHEYALKLTIRSILNYIETTYSYTYIIVTGNKTNDGSYNLTITCKNSKILKDYNVTESGNYMYKAKIYAQFNDANLNFVDKEEELTFTIKIETPFIRSNKSRDVETNARTEDIYHINQDNIANTNLH